MLVRVVGGMVVFVGREEELSTLRSWWAGKSPRPALVWGRRRVGKTALIQRFAEECDRVIFHTGTGDLEAAELSSLSYEVAEVFPEDLRDLTADPYRDWRDVLDHLARMAESGPVLLVLDEFPEVIESSPALPGILRAFLDRYGDRGGLRLLVCGSAVRTMWSVQETRSPLYGRFDLAMPLFPFRPAEAAAMLPGLSGADRALVYGILGGMPLYLSWWNESESPLRNLERLAGGPGSPILTEGALIMSVEVGGAEQSAFTLHAIANGRTRYGEIEQAIKADPARILSRLTDARLIERVTPVLAEPRQARRPIYRIADNFLAFYLGPLSRYRGQLERGRAAAVMPALIRHLDNHMGAVYEASFREHLWRLALVGELGEDVVEIGPWWDNQSQNEIDAVALAEPGLTRVPVLVGEAKWKHTADGRRIEWALDAKAAALGADAARIRHAICARHQVRDARPGTLVITAADIFG